MPLTPEQVQIVKSTAPILKEHGTAITTLFYRNMIAAHPELRNVFNLRNQVTGAQPAALARSVLAYATYIDDLGKLGGAVEHIAQKHVSLFIEPDQYNIVGHHLVEAFGLVLGDALTSEIKDAWVAAYGQLAEIFINREGALYKEAGEWKSWRKFAISKKVVETDTITSFYLKPVDGKPLPKYVPGQYVALQIPMPQIEGMVQSRQFSLSEAPKDSMGQYRVSIKREYTIENPSADDLAAGKVPGVVSNLLHNKYNVGDEVELSPPCGDFTFDAASTPVDVPVVLLSAGVGATPNMSILQAILASPAASSRPVTWVHGARAAPDELYAADIKQAARNNNIITRLFLSQPAEVSKLGDDYHHQGRVSLFKLQADKVLHLETDSAQYYVCGPEEFMISTRDWLEGQGIPRERIHVELFGTGGL